MGFGTSPAFLLTLLFVYLKLTNAVLWSWWWVLSPLWMAAILIAFCLALQALPLLLMSKQQRALHGLRRALERADRRR